MRRHPQIGRGENHPKSIPLQLSTPSREAKKLSAAPMLLTSAWTWKFVILPSNLRSFFTINWRISVKMRIQWIHPSTKTKDDTPKKKTVKRDFTSDLPNKIRHLCSQSFACALVRISFGRIIPTMRIGSTTHEQDPTSWGRQVVSSIFHGGCATKTKKYLNDSHHPSFQAHVFFASTFGQKNRCLDQLHKLLGRFSNVIFLDAPKELKTLLPLCPGGHHGKAWVQTGYLLQTNIKGSQRSLWREKLLMMHSASFCCEFLQMLRWKKTHTGFCRSEL